MGENWIVANLSAAISFFANQMSVLYDVLMVNPLTFRDGAMWATTDRIYDALLGPAISIMVCLFYLGLISESGEFIRHRRIGPVAWCFICMFFMAGILLSAKYILLLIFWIGREFMEKVVGVDGTNFLKMTWIELPDAVINATNDLSVSNGIIFWVVTLIVAFGVMICGFVIVMVIYGRIFKIFMHIAIAPVAFSTVVARTTRNTFASFLRSFIGVCLEGLVIVIICMLFSAFANGFDVKHPADNIQSEVTEDVTPEDVIGGIGDELGGEYDSSTSKAANAKIVWTYLGELIFMYLLMAGMIKGADDWLHQRLAL